MIFIIFWEERDLNELALNEPIRTYAHFYTMNEFTLSIVYVITMAVLIALELLEKSFLRYSKFRPKSGISSKTGMAIIYILPASSILVGYFYFPSANYIFAITVLLLFLHFVKRILEVFFLHKYCGPIDPFSSFMISIFYAIVALSILAFINDDYSTSFMQIGVGISAFVAGEMGNLYYHVLLARSRKNSKVYVLIETGLFKYCYCPHYLFEIVSWLGIAIIANHFFSWLVFLMMSLYLLARALRTKKWYGQTFSIINNSKSAIFPKLL